MDLEGRTLLTPSRGWDMCSVVQQATERVEERCWIDQGKPVVLTSKVYSLCPVEQDIYSNVDCVSFGDASSTTKRHHETDREGGGSGIVDYFHRLHHRLC